MAAKKRWNELNKQTKYAIILLAIAQFSLQVAALRDISRRTPAEVNGDKRAWVAASFINFAGPAAYFLRGRKQP